MFEWPLWEAQPFCCAAPLLRNRQMGLWVRAAAGFAALSPSQFGLHHYGYRLRGIVVIRSNMLADQSIEERAV
eukprot:6467884-Amphidinium_carterae.1